MKRNKRTNAYTLKGKKYIYIVQSSTDTESITKSVLNKTVCDDLQYIAQ